MRPPLVAIPVRLRRAACALAPRAGPTVAVVRRRDGGGSSRHRSRRKRAEPARLVLRDGQRGRVALRPRRCSAGDLGRGGRTPCTPAPRDCGPGARPPRDPEDPPNRRSAPISRSSLRTTGLPGSLRGALDHRRRQRRRTVGVAETGADTWATITSGISSDSVGEDLEVGSQLLARLEQAGSSSWVSTVTAPSPGKCFRQPATHHGEQPLVEHPGEGRHPLRIVRRGSGSAGRCSPSGRSRSTTGARSRWMPRLRQAAPAASPRARTARRPAAAARAGDGSVAPQRGAAG